MWRGGSGEGSQKKHAHMVDMLQDTLRRHLMLSTPVFTSTHANITEASLWQWCWSFPDPIVSRYVYVHTCLHWWVLPCCLGRYADTTGVHMIRD